MQVTLDISDFRGKVLKHFLANPKAHLQELVNNEADGYARKAAAQRRSDLHESDETLLTELFDSTDYKDKIARDAG